ncbi:hypothetical protein AYO44_06925 [Planctomycetaceae bacterium SCGC AG-212-F19]|nr:hypothetical protein AYO44_06925 [Planctomycetaceae bacterium SCGC AG-212-F19]
MWIWLWHWQRASLVPRPESFIGKFTSRLLDCTGRANKAAIAKEHVVQCRLLRCIFGNSSLSYPAPARWPQTVVQLGEALYNGDDCCFALHDALLDAGHAELADHFRQERWHPKGCWVLDAILEQK